MEILPFIHRVPDVVANTYILIDSDGLTVLDTGLPYSYGRVLNYIDALGYHPHGVRRILLTHADRDHSGSAAALKTLTGALVYASASEASALRQGDSSREVRPNRWQKAAHDLLKIIQVKVPPTPVDEVLSEGDTLPIQGGLRVLETPGHTPGHLSFYAPQRGVLWVGDSFVSLGTRLRVSQGGNTWDETLSLESAQKQAALGARYFLAGHGPELERRAGRFYIITPPVNAKEEPA